MKRAYKVIMAMSLSAVIMLIVYSKIGFFFETNDDRLISEILSGAMTGMPDAHVIYVNWLLAFPLSLLYRVSLQIPWYGGMLLLFHFIIYSALLYNVWHLKRKTKEYFILTGVTVCWILLNLYLLSAVQFTSTAALMAGAGYACLFLRGSQGRKIFIFFELMAFLLRSQSMLMIQLIGGGTYICLLLVERKLEIRTKCREACVFILTLGGILLIGVVGNWIGYDKAEWHDYNQFLDALTEMFDFYGQPDYEEVKSILDKYEVSRVEYEAFCNNVILDWEISAECAQELAQYKKNISTRQLDISMLWDQAVSSEYLGVNMLVDIVWCAVLLWGLLMRRWRFLVSVAGGAIGRTAAWSYLLYNGRLPLRVTLPLLSCEALLLTVLLLRDFYDSSREATQKALALVLCGIFALGCYSSGKSQYARAKENQWQEIYIEGLVEVQAYCNERMEQRYLLDPWSLSLYYRGPALETRIYRSNNCAYAGTWYSNSPPIVGFLREYLGGKSDDIRLIVYDEGSGESYYTVVFMAEKLGRTPVIDDMFTVSNGGSYLVWAFE